MPAILSDHASVPLMLVKLAVLPVIENLKIQDSEVVFLE